MGMARPLQSGHQARHKHVLCYSKVIAHFNLFSQSVPDNNMSIQSTSDPRHLLGLSPTALPLLDYLSQVARLSGSDHVPDAEIKSYPDSLYKNYYSLGLSLMFVAKDGSKFIRDIDPESDNLVLDSIDIYNAEPEKEKSNSKDGSSPKHNYTSYPALPLVLSLLPTTDASKPRSNELIITASSAGKEIVGALGEPDRKGGGTGPSSGSINIWCEWVKDGIMVEFGGPNANGPHAWERGKDAKWRIITLFRDKAM